MGARERMLEVLQASEGGVCDDCVWEPAGMKYRQQARARGLELEHLGAVRRVKRPCSICGATKTVSVITGRPLPEPSTAGGSDDAPWHWEGNVQAKLVEHLEREGWIISSTANTASKESGVDVIATDRDGAEWWISVKGYPERKPDKKTNPSTQARHWFSHAMFDVIVYRTARPDIRIGVAIPGPYPTYEALTAKSAWLRENAPFRLFVVHETGRVTSED